MVLVTETINLSCVFAFVEVPALGGTRVLLNFGEGGVCEGGQETTLTQPSLP